MYGVSRLDVCEDVAAVTFSRIPPDIGLISEIFLSFGEAGINIDMVTQTSPVGDAVDIAFTCLDKDLRAVLDISRGLREKYPRIKSLVSSGNCKIQLYGEEMREMCGVFARVLSVLARIGVEPQLIATSEVDISLLLTAVNAEPARRALQEEFLL